MSVLYMYTGVCMDLVFKEGNGTVIVEDRDSDFRYETDSYPLSEVESGEVTPQTAIAYVSREVANAYEEYDRNL